MTLFAKDLLSCLGRANTDSTVAALLNELGLQGSKFKPKRGESDIAFDMPPRGIDLVFSDPAVHDVAPGLPQGSLILSAMIFFAEGSQGHRQYAEALPHGVAFAMTRPAVQKAMGVPEWSSPLLPIDRWRTGSYQTAIWFDESSDVIAYVNCSLPER